MQAIKQMLMLKIFICSYSPMHKLATYLAFFMLYRQAKA